MKYIVLFVFANFVALFSPLSVTERSIFYLIPVLILCICFSCGWPKSCRFHRTYYSVKPSVFVYFRLAMCFALFLVVQSSAVHRIIAYQIDSNWHGQNIQVTGRVSGIPERDGDFTRFHFLVTSAQVADSHQSINFSKGARLSWRTKQNIAHGERWQFIVRLKPPRGFVNPRGFDYQAWLLSKDIFATGYVYKDQAIRLADKRSWNILGVDFSFGNESRNRVSKKLFTLLDGVPQKALIRALLIGDKTEITSSQWKMFQATGTVHLMAISGLHIGLIACLALVIGRVLFSPFLYLNRPDVYRVCVCMLSISAALCYANLSGFAIPTQRACFCVLIIYVLQWLEIRANFLFLLGVVACGMLLRNPFLVMQGGFTLSFAAVAILVYLFSNRKRRLGNIKLTNHSVRSRRVVLFVFAQYGLWLGLFPILVVMQLPISVTAPVVNTFSIPIISLLVLPLLFVALGVAWVSESLSHVLFQITGKILNFLVQWLQFFSTGSEVESSFIAQASDSLLRLFQWRHALDLVELVLLALSVVLILSPRPLRLRAHGMAILILVVIHTHSSSSRQKPWLTVLDVGQGLSTVLHGESATMIFDIGAKFSDSFSIANQVLLPYLNTNMQSPVSLLVLSHADNDHAGAADTFVENLRQIQSVDFRVISGEVDDIPIPSALDCSPKFLPERGALDSQISIELLWPNASLIEGTEKVFTGNNASCVLYVEMDGLDILIAGDIEKDVEHLLLRNKRFPKHIDVLIAPHHGSATSSTLAFVQHVRPKHVIFSAGYKNRYRHPSKRVVERYRELDSTIWNTATDGAISVERIEGAASITAERCTSSRAWHTDSCHIRANQD